MASDSPDGASAISRLVISTHELAEALEKHRDVAIAPELREQLAGFVAAIRSAISVEPADEEDLAYGDRVQLSL